MTKSKIAHLAMIIQTLLVSPGYTFAKWATNEIDAFPLMMLRAFGAASIFGLILLADGGYRKAPFTRGDLKKFILLALAGTVLNQFFFILGVKYASPAVSAIIYSLTPMVVLLFSVFILRNEKFSTTKIIGAGVALAGVCIVIATPSGGQNTPILTGALLTACGLLCWAGYLAYSKPMVEKHGPIPATATVMMLGMALFLPFGVSSLADVPYTEISWKGWFGLGYMIAVNSILSYYLILFAMERIEASRVAIYINLQPATAAAFSALTGGDKLTLPMLLGGGLTIVGVFTLNRAQTKKKSIEQNNIPPTEQSV